MPKAKATAKTKTQRDTATILIGLFDGTRNALPPAVEVLLRVRDGAQNEVVNRFVKGSSLKVTVPYSDNFKDAYTALVSSDGFRDAGFHPVKVSPDQEAHVNLMLVSKK